MNEAAGQEQQEERAAVPLSFKVTCYWKLGKGQYGPTQVQTRRLSLREVLDVLLENLTDEEAAVTHDADGTVTTLVIDWSKIPREILNPWAFGVRR